MKIDVYDLKFQGWTASVLLHFILLVLFFTIGVNLESLVEEYSEILLFDLSSAPASRVEDVSAGFPVATAPQRLESTEVVRLPERRPAQVRPEEVSLAATRREASVQRLEPVRLVAELERAGQERPLTNLQGGPGGNKPTPSLPGLREGLLLPDVQPSATGVGPDLPYLIEWIGQSREIIRSELPEYPAGVDRDVELRFQFSVTPKGDVTAIRPRQKGEPALEEVAITALRQWRFQSLPQASPQTNQEAVVTFRFKIRPLSGYLPQSLR